jgi:hypothetical protein
MRDVEERKAPYGMEAGSAAGCSEVSNKLYYGHPDSEQAECYSTYGDIGVHALSSASLRPDGENEWR